jgi:hypothetical protein
MSCGRLVGKHSINFHRFVNHQRCVQNPAVERGVALYEDGAVRYSKMGSVFEGESIVFKL